MIASYLGIAPQEIGTPQELVQRLAGEAGIQGGRGQVSP
jgi:hypothetical protein